MPAPGISTSSPIVIGKRVIEQACQPDVRRANLTGTQLKPLVP